MTLLRVENLGFAHVPGRPILRDISFEVPKGARIGLVGESGSGKSTILRLLLGLETVQQGRILFDGAPFIARDRRGMRDYRRRVQAVFQDPYSSLNPRERVGALVREPLDLMDVGDPAVRDDRVRELFDVVGLRPDQMALFPHQFSGGQRQRISIARALATNPQLIVCDEPVSALDVAIQAQILNLLRRLQDELGLSYLFISHDLGVVEHISDRVVILYLGRVVEIAPTEALFAGPRHPYTQALLAEVPRLSTEKRRFQPIKGEIPSPLDPPPGCHFHTRCPFAGPRCSREVPRLLGDGANAVACHLHDGGVA